MGVTQVGDTLTSFFTWQNATVAITIYLTSLAFYRLLLHPLARFPGPKLAALTRWYEAYYDVVKGGRYMNRVAEMHKEYGPIIRISPFELHVNDPAFFGTLYSQDGRWEKYAWSYDGMAAPGATLTTADHDLHRSRRQPLNSFFSKAKVMNQQDLVRRQVVKLCSRLSESAATSKKTIDLGAAISAFSRDVASEFILGRSYQNLDEDDFNAGITSIFQGVGMNWRVTKHVTWFGPTLMAIPKSWSIKVAPERYRNFFRYLLQNEQDIKEIMDSASRSSKADMDPSSRRTIIHEILDSDLPSTEKHFDRLFSDVGTVTAAGFETTSSVLRLIVFHVFSNPDMLGRLRAEIAAAAVPSDPSDFDVKILERLPYLTAIITEGLRLSPAVSVRMQRIAPDRDLVYGTWRIPAGTPVGMTLPLINTVESLYPMPTQFVPDRWMDPAVRKKTAKSFAPFSRGTRACLGMHLAWAEMYLALTALVQLFDFNFDGATAEDFLCESDQFVIGTRGRGILKARPRPRQD